MKKELRRVCIKFLHKVRVKPKTIMNMFNISRATFYRNLKR